MYPQHFAGGSYGASMYSPDDDYYHSSRGGSYYGRPNYLGGGSYMVSIQHADTHYRS